MLSGNEFDTLVASQFTRGLPTRVGGRAGMGQEFKSGPDITGFDYEAGSGQDLVWSLLIGKITQYHVFTLS